MAGHSKYKNIMHSKGAQDKKRSGMFSKLSRELTVAAVPALRQLAVFAGGSVAAALVLTLLVLPPWLAGLRATAPMQRLANTLEHLTEARGRRFSCVALVIGLLFACFGYARANLVDDIRALRSDDQSLRLEMTAMQRALGQDSSPTLLVSTARTEQEALAVNERLYRSLRSRIGQEHVHSIAPFLPSLADQEQRAAAFRERAPQLEPEITSALERAGLDASQFSSAQPAFVRIAPSDLLNSPLRSLLRPFRVVARSGVHYLTYVETHVPDLEALVARVPGAQIFSEASYLQRAYARFRARTGRLVVVGLVLVFAICALRYRSWKRGALAIVPALAASFIAVGVAAFWSHQIHLLHFAAVLMVLSMGEDYAVFMLEVRDARETKGTLVGIFLAAATTVVSFLLLAFSHEPALAALGQVVSIGIVYSFLLAPLVRRVAPFHP